MFRAFRGMDAKMLPIAAATQAHEGQVVSDKLGQNERRDSDRNIRRLTILRRGQVVQYQGLMKLKTVIRKLVLPLVAMTIASAHGATFYVSTQGSDSNPGTSAQPFRTITHAYSQAGPGTTILVLPGVYTDYTSGWGLHLGASGTSSSPIVLQSQVRGGAVIDGQNASDRNEAIYIDGSYNVVQGFEIRNGPNGGISIWANGNQILDNEIHHNGNPASTSGNGHDGVYDNENTSGNIYARNYIHNNGRTGGSKAASASTMCSIRLVRRSSISPSTSSGSVTSNRVICSRPATDSTRPYCAENH